MLASRKVRDIFQKEDRYRKWRKAAELDEQMTREEKSNMGWEEKSAKRKEKRRRRKEIEKTRRRENSTSSSASSSSSSSSSRDRKDKKVREKY